MHWVVAALFSSSPSIYLIFGLIMLFGSTLARRLIFKPSSGVANAGNGPDAGGRIRNRNVVPINRSARSPKPIDLASRRLSNGY
jgi:hypothetical protein